MVAVEVVEGGGGGVKTRTLTHARGRRGGSRADDVRQGSRGNSIGRGRVRAYPSGARR